MLRIPLQGSRQVTCQVMRVRGEAMKLRMALSLLSISIALLQGAAQNRQDNPGRLAPGEPLERELRKGESHTYKINLNAGDFLHVIVEQRGLDVALTLIEPGGKRLLEVDSPASAQEAEWLTYLASAAGEYKIEVRAVDKQTSQGRYAIRVEEQRKSQSADAARLSAQRLFVEAKHLYDEDRADSYRQAIEKYQAALALYREAGRRTEEAVTLTCLARTCTQISDHAAALTHYNQALAIYQEMQNLSGAGATANGIGYVYYLTNRYEEASKQFERALDTMRGAGNRAGEARTLINLCFAYQSLNKYDKASTYAEQALQIYRELKDRAGEAEALNSQTFTYWMTDQYEKAIGWGEQALAAQRELKDRAGEAITLNRLGWVYYKLGQSEKAVSFYEQALLINRELKDRAAEASTLSTLGLIVQGADIYAKRRAYYEQALQIYRELKDRLREARTIDSLAINYFASDQYDQAIIWYKQSLEIWRELKDRAEEARVLDRLGFAYRKQSQIDAAVACYQQMLAIRREQKDRAGEAAALDNIAFTYYVANEYDQAIRAYEPVLASYRELKDRAREAATLSAMGDTNFGAKQYEKAVDFYQQALGIRRELKDRGEEANALKSLAFTFSRLKLYEKSSDYYQQALAIQRELKDSFGEGNILDSMAGAYAEAGETEKAIAHYEQALKIWREKQYRNFEGYDLSSLGLVYERLHESQKAISYYEQALALRREMGDRPNEALVLIALGRVYTWTDNEKANGYYEQALALQRAIGDRHGEVKTLNLLGVIQAKMSHYDKELAYYEQALTLARQLKDRTGECMALDTLGITYLRLQQYDKAIGYLNQSLILSRELKNRSIEAGILSSLGMTYALFKQNEKALSHLEAALAAAREAEDRANESRALTFASALYSQLNQAEKATEYIEQGLALARKMKDPMSEATALIFLCSRDIRLKQLDKAAGHLEQALTLVRQLKVRELEADVMAMLMAVWAERRQPRLAVVFGKKSINIFQQIRNELPDLDQTLRQSFMQKKQSQYRQLADLLAGLGRLAEAQQVLGLLKEDEFTSFVMRDRNVAAGESRLSLTASEAEWEKRYEEIADRLTTIGARRATLLRKPERSTADDKELTALEADLEIGNRAFQAFLNSVESAVADPRSASNQITRVREAEGLMETLRELGPGSVAVYTIVGEQGYRSILITPDVQKGYSYPITAADLNKKILAFREVVRNPNLDPRPLAKELYDILVKPLEKDLEGAEARTIMWSLDGALRYLPVATLYDGKAYLVERYANVVFTPASQSRLKDNVSRDWRGLGLGVSLAHEGFQPLPNVVGELHAIIQSSSAQGILPGTVKLDGDFTRDGFRAELRKHYSVVHVASHFDFVPGTDRNSFLLLGDGGKLTLEEFRNMPQVLQGVELLTLSACDTAVGGEDADGKEVEGFAVLAQRQGAKAVVATLWAVADESTALLMKEFYRRRMTDPNISKAEALRQAQLALLTGQLRGDVSTGRGPRTTTDGAAAKFVKDPERPFAHPYFWAPFLLMGNWK
jgi:CHAT domain-containing protein/uncharacterized protein HemY